MRLLILFILALSAQAQSVGISFGGTVRYNDQFGTTGRFTDGDTWHSSWGATAKLITCNDCGGATNLAGAQAIRVMSISTDLMTVTPVNTMGDFGSAGTWTDGFTWKSDGFFAYNGCHYLFVYRQQPSQPYNNQNISLMQSCDNGATWKRSQDLTTGANGNAPTSPNAMWASTNIMGHPVAAQFCADNVSCSATPDSSSTYIVGVSTDSTWGGSYAWRVLKSDVASLDASKYQYWTGSGWSSTIGSAAQMQCVINGVTTTMTTSNCGAVDDVAYYADAAMAGGGVYVLTTYPNPYGGMVRLWTASTITGPWTQIGTVPMDSTRSPIPAAILWLPVPWSYQQISSSPYSASIKLLGEGKYTQQTGSASTDDYSLFFMDAILTNVSAAPVKPKTYSFANIRDKFNATGLEALWEFQDWDIHFLADTGPKGLYSAPSSGCLVSGGTTGVTTALWGRDGSRNTRYSLRTQWLNYPFKCGTGFGLAMTDMSVLLVMKPDDSGAADQIVLGGNFSGNQKGFHLDRHTDGTMYLVIQNTFPATSSGYAVDGQWLAMMWVRSGANWTIYKWNGSTVTTDCASGCSIAANTTANGAYNLYLGSQGALGTTTYGSATLGTIGIWSRALSAREVAQTFQVVHSRARFRGWTGL